MTEEELEELIRDCPKLYHMAERGSRLSIEKYGLRSTSALLDLYEVTGEKRKAIEGQHRPRSVCINDESPPKAVIRDQKAMSDGGLRRCLRDQLSPADWYKILNSKVFFWLTKKRLVTFASAIAYRDKEHDVLEICTRSLVEKHREKIWLCPINSGCTNPSQARRGKSTFSKIDDYRYDCWRKKRKAKEPVVELAVDYSVPDIKQHVSRIGAVKGDKLIFE